MFLSGGAPGSAASDGSRCDPSDGTVIVARTPLGQFLPSPAKRGDRRDINEFFSVGRREIDMLVGHLRGLAITPGSRALAFGCGFGVEVVDVRDDGSGVRVGATAGIRNASRPDSGAAAFEAQPQAAG